MHLLHVGDEGWLEVTPEFIRAYLRRPEVHPIAGSCSEEVKLHDDLMQDPFLEIPRERLDTIGDRDAAENYAVVLAYRDLLKSARTIEAAYLALVRHPSPVLPPIFMDQMVHLIMRNTLKDVRDPIRLRAAEIFFREQSVSTDDGHLMLADEEIVDMHAQAGVDVGLGQLLSDTATAVKRVTLDVLHDGNENIYWERSDRFDTVIDFGFEKPALNAFARVIEAWLGHLLRLDVEVEPCSRVRDTDWRWHIGLDRDASTILDALYEGDAHSGDDLTRIIGLFRMRIPDERLLLEHVHGRPIYLALAMSQDNRVKMKPQNLLTNLPPAYPV